MYADAAPNSEAATLVRRPLYVHSACYPRALRSLRAELDAPHTHRGWYLALAASLAVAAIPWLLLFAPTRGDLARPRETPGYDGAPLRGAPRPSAAETAGDDDVATAGRAEPRLSPTPRASASARRREPPPPAADETAGAPLPDVADLLEAPLRP